MLIATADGRPFYPVIDISRHQGTANFSVMISRGVEGVIIRSNHAHIVDDRCAGYVAAARASGFRDDQIGFYTFCNPKRATGYASGKAFVDTVRKIFGHTDTILMLDIENYAPESGSGPLIQGPTFAAWIREHIRAIQELAPDSTLIAYTNKSYWNGNAGAITGVTGPWVGDAQLASELEWIIARYPVYSVNGYVLHPLSPSPADWADWAYGVGPSGPFAPIGATEWGGWQFSAGYNDQGPVYGFQSDDLDLNIIKKDAWERWVNTVPVPVPIPVPPLPPLEEPVKPYIFKLGSGQHGIRHENGSRFVDGTELVTVFGDEDVYDVPEDSNWEGWILAELEAYTRSVYPPAPPPVGTVEIASMTLHGTLTPDTT